MREEKARLERAAMLMFVRAMRLTYRRDLRIIEQRERPDFLAMGHPMHLIGVELTHLYHNAEEARFLNGRASEEIHPLTTVDELLDALNRSLHSKAALSYGYEMFDRLWLLIRVTSPEVQKRTILDHWSRIVIPPSAFHQIWMLFYDFDHLDWADLLRLQ